MFGLFRRRKKEDREFYRLLKDIFGLKPNNVELYKLALIHRSASQFLKKGVPINNERLEFLGDAVIESVVSDFLFIEFPHESEGFLTQMRSRLVNRATLNELCKDIGLAKHIRSNAGGGGEQKNLNGDAFEAIIGAMYLDKGYEFTNRTLIRLISKNITRDEMTTTETDFKSRLIEWCQRGRHHIRFSTSFGQGASRNAPQFKSVAMIDGMEIGYGLGASKKEAEQRAAYSVLQALDDETGDAILEMVDKHLGDTGPEETAAAEQPKSGKPRRKRGGVKHRKHKAEQSTAGNNGGAEQGIIGGESGAEPTVVVEAVTVEIVEIDTVPAGDAMPTTETAPEGSPEKPVATAPKRGRGRPKRVVTQAEGGDGNKPQPETGDTAKVNPKGKPAGKKSMGNTDAKPSSPKSKSDKSAEGKTVATAKKQAAGKSAEKAGAGKAGDEKERANKVATAKKPAAGNKQGAKKTTAESKSKGEKKPAAAKKTTAGSDAAKRTTSGSDVSKKAITGNDVAKRTPVGDAAATAGPKRRGRPRKVKPEENQTAQQSAVMAPETGQVPVNNAPTPVVTPDSALNPDASTPKAE